MAEVPLYTVDASVATKWHLKDEAFVEPSIALLEDFREGRIRLIAPDHDTLAHFRKTFLKVQMAYKLKTALGKAIYAARKYRVEPVIGIIKEVLGFRQFSLRGAAAVAGEWCLVCLAFNLKRLHSLTSELQPCLW